MKTSAASMEIEMVFPLKVRTRITTWSSCIISGMELKVLSHLPAETPEHGGPWSPVTIEKLWHEPECLSQNGWKNDRSIFLTMFIKIQIVPKNWGLIWREMRQVENAVGDVCPCAVCPWGEEWGAENDQLTERFGKYPVPLTLLESFSNCFRRSLCNWAKISKNPKLDTC